jgi:hypothetical protein
MAVHGLDVEKKTSGGYPWEFRRSRNRWTFLHLTPGSGQRCSLCVGIPLSSYDYMMKCGKIQLPELFIQKCILVDLRDVDRPLSFIGVFYQLV